MFLKWIPIEQIFLFLFLSQDFYLNLRPQFKKKKDIKLGQKYYIEFDFFNHRILKIKQLLLYTLS